MSQPWPGYGPPYGPPPNPGVRNNATAALVANIVAVVLCCGVASIGGLICAAIAMSKADYEPDTASKLIMWAWILLGVSVVLDIVFVILLIAFPVIMAGIFGSVAGSY